MKYAAIVSDTMSYPSKVVAVFQCKTDAREFVASIGNSRYEVSTVPYFNEQGQSAECPSEGEENEYC